MEPLKVGLTIRLLSCLQTTQLLNTHLTGITLYYILFEQEAVFPIKLEIRLVNESSRVSSGGGPTRPGGL